MAGHGPLPAVTFSENETFVLSSLFDVVVIGGGTRRLDRLELFFEGEGFFFDLENQGDSSVGILFLNPLYTIPPIAVESVCWSDK